MVQQPSIVADPPRVRADHSSASMDASTAGTHARETNACLAQRQFGRCACEAPLARRSVRPAGAVPAEVPVVPKLPDRRRNVALAGAAESAVKAIGRDDRTTSDARGISAYPRRPGASSSRPQSLFREVGGGSTWSPAFQLSPVGPGPIPIPGEPVEPPLASPASRSRAPPRPPGRTAKSLAPYG